MAYEPAHVGSAPESHSDGSIGIQSYASADRLREILVRMLRIRVFDELAIAIRATSIPGGLHGSIGQEGEIVGACMALRDDDYMTGNHRSHGHPIGKGIGLAPLMAELFGKETGVCRGKGGSMHLAAFGAGGLGESGIVGGSMPVATGAALSAHLRGTSQVCLSFFGDGAANCGAFHESLNLAAVWKLPVIFLCENNGYAIFTSQAQTTSIADIASRAVSYGMPGVIVDGQDVLAVHKAVSQAAARARSGEGPTLVEAKTYRYCEHEEGEDIPAYRTEAEKALWISRDPIEMYVTRLLKAEVLSTEEIAAVRTEVQVELEAALEFAKQSPMPDPAALLDDLFV